MKLDSLRILLVLVILFANHPSAAVKGNQRPNTTVSVPLPTIAMNVVDRLGTAVDHQEATTTCRCALTGRTTNDTPAECLDYCIWRYGWY
jgi:hypothetical protein